MAAGAGCRVTARLPSRPARSLGAIAGLLKAYCNVNEVISGIMLNWIVLYADQHDPHKRQGGRPAPIPTRSHSATPQALLPSLGLDKLFSDNQYVDHCDPAGDPHGHPRVGRAGTRRRFGYELKATGFNKHAAKYCGMAREAQHRPHAWPSRAALPALGARAAAT